MTTLYEKFYNQGAVDTGMLLREPEEIAQLLLDICDAIETEEMVQVAPEDIIIDEEEEGVSLKENFVFRNLYYAAPEVAVEGKEADKNSGWFTFGLLMYFIMKGRSYYANREIRMVDLPDLMEQGNALIQKSSEEDKKKKKKNSGEELYDFFLQCMEKLTSWNPLEREEGADLFVDKFWPPEDEEEVEEAEEMEKTPNVQPEEEEQEEAHSDSEQEEKAGRETPKSKETSAESKKAEETAAEEPKLDHFLFVKESSSPKMMQLMKLGDEQQEHDLEVIRDMTRRYFFYLVKGDPVQKRVVSKQEVYHLDIPEDSDGGCFQLRVTYHPTEGCTLALYDGEGITQVSDNVMCFQV